MKSYIVVYEIYTNNKSFAKAKQYLIKYKIKPTRGKDSEKNPTNEKHRETRVRK